MSVRTYRQVVKSPSPKVNVESADLAELRQLIANTPLEPKIINPDSHFVMVTYWWGRGNINKNTQSPCPDEIEEGQPVTVAPIKYDEMIQKWVRCCEKAKCNYLVQEYPQFAVRGKYQMAINAKPLFIAKALEACVGRAVVYIDGDMTVERYPHIFDMRDVDYMARGWNIDPRSVAKYKDEGNVCFDPYIFETSGGTMYFGNTKMARSLLKLWATVSTEPKKLGKADDRIISMVLTTRQEVMLMINIIQLPMEYLWLTKAYTPRIRGKIVTYLRSSDWSRNHIFIEHPECLTAEDVAIEQGAAATGRNPDGYDQLVQDKVECATHGGIFYERIFFDDEKMVASYKPYLNYLRNETLFIMEDDDGNEEPIPCMYVEPYSLSTTTPKRRKIANYGPHTKTVFVNRTRASQFGDLKAMENKVVNVYEADIEKLDGVNGIDVREENVVPLILCLLANGNDVFYRPKDAYNARAVSKSMLQSQADFVAANMASDDLRPHFHKDSAVYFKSGSRILFQMLSMCKTLRGDLTNIFNSSYHFMSRIRCMWVDPIIVVKPKSPPKAMSKLERLMAAFAKSLLKPEPRSSPSPSNSSVPTIASIVTANATTASGGSKAKAKAKAKAKTQPKHLKK